MEVKTAAMVFQKSSVGPSKDKKITASVDSDNQMITPQMKVKDY
jgi:hypothetical protein